MEPEKKENNDENKKEASENDDFNDRSQGSNKAFLIAVAFILLLIGLFFSIRFFYSPEQIFVDEFYTYNGFDFAKIGGTWFTEIQIENRGYIVEARFGPREVEDIHIDYGVYEKVTGADEIFVSVPKDPGPVIAIAGIEIVRITGTYYEILNIPTRGAALEPDGDLIVKTCEDAGNGTAVIVLDYGDETKVYLEDECIIVQGTDEWEIVRAADRLVFSLLQIM